MYEARDCSHVRKRLLMCSSMRTCDVVVCVKESVCVRACERECVCVLEREREKEREYRQRDLIDEIANKPLDGHVGRSQRHTIQLFQKFAMRFEKEPMRQTADALCV